MHQFSLKFDKQVNVFRVFFYGILERRRLFSAHKGATITIFSIPSRRHSASLFQYFLCYFGVRRVPLGTPGPPKEHLNRRDGCRAVPKSIFHGFLMDFGVPGGDRNRPLRLHLHTF